MSAPSYVHPYIIIPRQKKIPFAVYYFSIYNADLQAHNTSANGLLGVQAWYENDPDCCVSRQMSMEKGNVSRQQKSILDRGACQEVLTGLSVLY